MAGTYEKKPYGDSVTSFSVIERDGVVATVGTPSVTIKEVDASGDVTYAVGATVPTDGDAGYAVACFFKNTSGGSGTTLYVNEGTSTSASFRGLESSVGGGALTINSASTNALAVGPNGTTNPTFNVDTSTASAATGLKVKSAAAGAGVAVSVISSGTNENLTIDGKGSGQLLLNQTATGDVYCKPLFHALNATGPIAGGGFAVAVGSTAAFGLYFGSGAPTISAAQGSLYLRTDGSSTSTRMYVNTNASTTWTAVTTAA